MPQDPFRKLIETPEGLLVKAMLRDQILASPIAIPSSIKGPSRGELQVSPERLGLAADAFGDADAIFIEEGRPDRASAVEFKRVKISTRSLQTGQPGKLGALKKAVHQANALYAAGFAFVWVAIVVVADMRSVGDGTMFPAPPLEQIHKIRKAVPLARLAPGIGVEISELVQVSNQPANHRGSAGWHLLRAAEEQPQPRALTDAIGALFA